MRNTLLKMTMVTMTVVVLILSLGISVSAAGNSPGKGNNVAVRIIPLSDQEKTDLIFLREEEKLARDVYIKLYDTWRLAIFKNISASEQKHMEAIKILLDKYGIADPALSQGEFSEGSDLQDLYDALVAQGSQYQVEAFNVGVIIETKDITDLEEAIGQTTHNDILNVYNNLLLGSNNHLDVFNSYPN